MQNMQFYGVYLQFKFVPVLGKEQSYFEPAVNTAYPLKICIWNSTTLSNSN